MQCDDPPNTDDRDCASGSAAQTGEGFPDHQPAILDPLALGDDPQDSRPGGGQESSELDPLTSLQISWGRGRGLPDYESPLKSQSNKIVGWSSSVRGTLQDSITQDLDTHFRGLGQDHDVQSAEMRQSR
jgi:hypothetical protein